MPDPSDTASRPSRWRLVLLLLAWGASLAAAAGVGAFLMRYREPILRRLGRLALPGAVTTNLYTVALTRVPVPIDGRYGGIAPLGDGILYASRSGRMWFVDSARTLKPLALRVPIDIATFDADPYNGSTTDRDNFAVKDLLVQPVAGGVRIAASYSHWHPDRDCYVLRVALAEVAVEALLAGGTAEWRVLHETAPCRELGLLANGQRRPTIGAGGRLAVVSADTLLLTVGAFGNEGTADEPGQVTAIEGSYGRTFLLDVRGGGARELTRGHRNPQGLAIGPDGRRWLTEHAARGGDELNLLVEGRDYGFPHVSYGTAYGMMTWPPSGTPGRHEGYAKPMHAWVPSIASSQLIVVDGSRFTHWRGDLLVSSLVGRELRRVRVEEDRVIFDEPIPIGHRIRDIVETARGEIVLFTEDAFLVYLTPLDAAADDPDLLPRERGLLVAGRCQGCHTFNDGGANGLGPNLHGIVGRRVASSGGFPYSTALQELGGRWDEDRLRRFLLDPAAYAPGTTMAIGDTLTAREVDDLLTYLRSLR